MPKLPCRSCNRAFLLSELTSVHTLDDCDACDYGEDDLGHEMEWICADCHDDEENANVTTADRQREIARGNGDLTDDSGDEDED